MANPLEQFRIKPLIPISLGEIDISFTNSTLFMILSFLVVVLLFWPTRSHSLIPSRMQILREMIYEFLTDVVKTHVGTEGRKFFPLILSLFLFIMMGNLLGLIPYSFTFTSHIAVTFSLALLVFITVTLIGVFHQGLHFLRMFWPKDTPWYIAPLLVPVEIISYFSRPVSLGVRLFANMVAGHAMLKIFAGFVVVLASGLLIPVAILPFVVSMMITVFEVFIALLQAYVFTILTCIYLNDVLNGH